MNLLHHEFALYFPNHDEALPPIASTCHYCRMVYASQMTVLRLDANRLALPSQSVTVWEARVDSHAQVLGGLLRRLPALIDITGDRAGSCAEEMLGRALLNFPTPSKLTAFGLYAGDQLAPRWRYYSPASCHPRFCPDSLTKALDLDHFNMLEDLRLCEDVWCLKEERNSEVFINAIAAGQLSRIRKLRIRGGLYVDVLLLAFQRALEAERQQACLE